jgi:cysteine desulfurase family protein (TIGR01976 family)
VAALAVLIRLLSRPSARLGGMGYDVHAVRAHFPALAVGAAHFDGPGGSQVPDSVAAAVADTLLSPLANRGSVTAAERTADAVVLAARAAMGDLLGADPRGVVFGRSMTALTFDLARTLAAGWRPGDEVIVTRLDHDANIRPWLYAAQAVGATVRWAEFDPRTAELTVADVARELSSRTRVVAVTGGSNLLGTRPPVPLIAAAAHERGALVFVDGVHLTAHVPVDVAALGADFYACSPYKFLGPHCGVLAAAPGLLESLTPEKLAPSPDTVPERFELGTLPYELLAGTTAAVDFLAGLDVDAAGTRRERLTVSMATVERHEDGLRHRIEEGLARLPGVTVHSRAASRTPTLLLSFPGRDPQDAYRFLAERGVNAPAGTFYALEASRRLGFGDRGALRVGLAPYTDDTDVDRLLTGLGEFTSGE